MTPPRRYRTLPPFARAQLAPRRRSADPSQQPTITINPTLPRIVLLRAVAGGEVKPGTGRYVGGWRWLGTTVTNRIHELIRGGWIERAPDTRHLNVTAIGEQILAGAPAEGRNP